MADDANIKAVRKKLKELEKIWPKGYWLLNSSNHLILSDGHPEDGGKSIEDYNIPCDGGDFDWKNQ
jgi:hypothetical protein